MEGMEKESLHEQFKHNGFKVPENYFEALEERVIKHLPKEDKRRALPKWKHWSIAASLFIAAGLGAFYFMSRKDEVIDIATASISTSELEEYENNVEVSDDELADIVSLQLIDSLYQTRVISAKSKSREHQKEIESIEEEYSPLDDVEIEI